MGEVEERRTPHRPRVHDLEDGLKVAVQIHHRLRIPRELERLIAGVPPSMHGTAGNQNGFAGADRELPPVDHGGQRAGLTVPPRPPGDECASAAPADVEGENPSIPATPRRRAARA